MVGSRHVIYDVDWVILDADNTLWDLEYLYHNARRRLCTFLGRYGFDEIEVASFQQKRDAELYHLYGRQPNRFPQSFVETLLWFNPDASSAEINAVWKIGEHVFAGKAPPYLGVEEALREFLAIATVGIFTAGHEDVQWKRLQEFPAIHLVGPHQVVVEKKDTRSFGELCEYWRIDRRRSWMVGDSLTSDIIPAQEAGLRTVWIQNDNWAPIEMGDIDPVGIRTEKATTLLEAVAIIKASRVKPLT